MQTCYKIILPIGSTTLCDIRNAKIINYIKNNITTLIYTSHMLTIILKSYTFLLQDNNSNCKVRNEVP